MGSIDRLKEEQVLKSTGRMKMDAYNDAPVQAIKRRVYMASTAPAVIFLMIFWVASYTYGEVGFIDRFTVPILSTVIVFLLILLRLNRIKLIAFETIAFCIVFIFMISKIYMDFYRLVQVGETIASSDLLYTPLLYILGFTLLGKRRGFISALVFLISLMFIGMIFVFQSVGMPEYILNALQIMELFLVSVVSILLLYLLSYIGEQHFKAHVLAEVNARLANTDSLTQVDNRRQLEEHIETEINRAVRQRRPLTVLMLDFDHFKKVNDQYGHTAGDSVLVNIAGLISKNLRSMDHFGRWGGDEFICVAANTDIDTATLLAERIRSQIEGAQFQDSPSITCSIGITAFIKGDTPNELISRVDKGLMQAKAAGRNRVACILPGDEPLG
ncbi:GGDEF domain-containing protein [Chloroflexota bacterium]